MAGSTTINEFFDQVLVMTDDLALRAARPAWTTAQIGTRENRASRM